ncbi:MAG: sigma-70 family RNA polymerase sigma factor [Firmicutes bacterium]|nr:sigma-70 family RNA polymerase sigma factor [Bacillota bacterium]
MVPDEALVRQSRQGSEEAFRLLVERYQAKIYNLAYRLLGNPEDASDLTQEVFCRVYVKLPAFRGEASLSTWVYRIANNLCLDELRRRGRRPQVSLDASLSGEQPPREVTSSDPGPAELSLRRASLARLQELIAALPLEQKTAVVLRDIQGLSYEEMAQVLGCSLGTVKSRLNRARRTLRDKLRAERELFLTDCVYNG